ncbi:M1 family metallopeptidase [Labilibacter marinus]|uniref:M1 family metallopeptidase n=1 Tax=Labilibacter marinus TaxID=1477105 RepID=UPI0008298826|nr:M1 family aminopeptidase [Labilibacter marinus]
MKHIQLAFILVIILLSACKEETPRSLKKGVSWELAQERFKDISDIKYKLELTIPDSLKGNIQGVADIQLIKKSAITPLILDFASSPKLIKEVMVNDSKAFFSLENEHLVIPHRFLSEGNNRIEIKFTLGNAALNRNEDYMYSLFVPARARTAIPCFDQPDLKAEFSVSVNLPEEYNAITNGQLIYNEKLSDNRKLLSFQTSKPISSYLWAFTVGKFNKLTTSLNGRKISIYHMEKDSSKVKRNASQVFQQVFHSIDWLEDFTEVEFPFGKYDLVCIPSFQFAGMEHPGAIYYRSELLFLNETPTQKQLLRRAQLLAHETAHMWFGDLVTMKWFSGVWQKEVFANFIADKIVEEQFPHLNHKLTFLSAHFPASYSVDRTIGANSIQQKLDNLSDAGSMYGSIIYHKAPIMMNQLESLLGEDNLKHGLSSYLKKYAYQNATWDDLMMILNDLSEYDLALWSNTWVNEPGRPVIEFVQQEEKLNIIQKPEYSHSSKVWAQRINYSRITDSNIITEEVELLSKKTSLGGIEKQADFILPTVDQAGYGLFLMNTPSLQYALNNLHLLQDELCRGATLIQLYENFLHGNIHPEQYLKMLHQEITYEENEQILRLACNQLNSIFWRCTTSKLRNSFAENLEDTFMDRLNETRSSISLKKLLFNNYVHIVSSPSGLKKLNQVIKRKKVGDVKLSERELESAVYQLALKDDRFDNTDIAQFAHKLDDEDLKNRMIFVSQVFSANSNEINLFVESLNKLENRRKENWVLSAVYYLHHPYHEERNLKYLEGALKLTETIKETGDIFFPIGWLNNTLNGYNSVHALQIVDYFFKDNPAFPEDLKMKTLQSSDMVSRSRMIKEKYLN